MMRLRGGRGGYDTIGIAKPKPPPISDGTRVPKQTSWAEMNRRQRIHEHFKDATPQSDHEIEALDRAKSNEEERRLRWDDNWNERDLNTSVVGNKDVVLPALSALSISAEPTVITASDTPKSTTKRALTKMRGSLKESWTELTASAKTEERIAKRKKKEKKIKFYRRRKRRRRRSRK